MTPEDLSYLFSLTNEYRSIRYDLANMRILAHVLGDPQDRFKSVLIAGTNGKGSVGAFLSAMIPSAGFYTSPHLERLNERIRIGQSEIGDAELKHVFDRVRSARSDSRLIYPPTYFEVVTAMAFCFFAGRCAHAVLEVGLGGRLDATNVVHQDVSVITTIGLDHQEYLGDQLDVIAGEKAGIIKETEPVVIGPEVDFPVIHEKAGARLLRAGDVGFRARASGLGLFEIDLQTRRRQYTALRPSLRGRHQLDNVRTAVLAAEELERAGWPIGEAEIRQGIEEARWPGRLEYIAGTPAFILDGAHNPHAMGALVRHVAEFHPEGVWLIFGAMADKDWAGMLSLVLPHTRRVVFTKAQSHRSMDPRQLASQVSGSTATSDVREAIAYVREHAPSGVTVLVCGSLYLIGEARAVLE